MHHVLPAKARLADHLIPGGLEALLRTEREERVEMGARPTSFDTLARMIRSLTNGQIEVTGVSVASWCDRLEIGTDSPKAVGE